MTDAQLDAELDAMHEWQMRHAGAGFWPLRILVGGNEWTIVRGLADPGFYQMVGRGWRRSPYQWRRYFQQRWWRVLWQLQTRRRWWRNC